MNFNPRSRVGNDWVLGQAKLPTGISIHVPAWGTTALPLLMGVMTDISIHVPAWGTTHLWTEATAGKYISIHVPAWGTTKALSEHYKNAKISIHVPAWGTTANLANFVSMFLCKYNNLSFSSSPSSFSFIIFTLFLFAFFQFLWCESPGKFMYTSYSHYKIRI